MQATVIQVAQFGGPEVMEVVQRPLDPPQPGEVCIRQKAVGVNFLDVYHRTGLYPLPLPLTPGMEGAGVVEAVGPSLPGEAPIHLAVGDRVAYVGHPPGAYASWRCMPSKTVIKLPDSISDEDAAGMMLKGLTVQYLFQKTQPQGGLHPGDFALFHAGAGGVGLIACQWARAIGLRLIVTAGTDEKCVLALEHGAAYAINYRKENFVERVKEITQGQKVKVVYDSVGRDTWEGSLDCLQAFGLMVSFGNASGLVPPVALSTLSAKGSLFLTRPTLFTHLFHREAAQAMADDLFKMVTQGLVKIHIGKRYPLTEAAQAHRDLEARETVGASILLC
ncbi:MAG: quinone oxidoreductase family protein [Burkholderiales bacterium]